MTSPQNFDAATASAEEKQQKACEEIIDLGMRLNKEAQIGAPAFLLGALRFLCLTIDVLEEDHAEVANIIRLTAVLSLGKGTK